MLDALLRKAIVDAGFDLEPERDADWWRLRTSGLPGTVWIQEQDHAVALALPLAEQLQELDLPRTNTLQSLPPGASAAALLPDAVGLWRALRRLRVLLNESVPRLSGRLEAALAEVSSTEAEAIVRQRIGQDLFRKALIEYWEGKCAVSGIGIAELLRASHAKPWADCTDAERLDVHNGVLLAVHLDCLFDRGLLAFDDTGMGLFSPTLNPAVLPLLGINGTIRLRFVRPAHLPFLLWHREHVWRGPQPPHPAPEAPEV